MKLFQRIFDFILFRFSFEIKTDVDQEVIKKKLFDRFNHDPGFLYPAFENNKFAFSYVSLMPKFYNFSPITFEGEITKKDRVSIFISVRIIPIFFWLFVFAALVILIIHLTNLDGMKDGFQNTPFAIIVVFSTTLILIPYCLYAFKIYYVKEIIKSIVKREEKRANGQSPTRIQ